MRLLAGMTALCMLLSGCASLLNREYVSVTTHNMAPTAEGDSSTLRAESYQELVNALLYFITQGTEEGSIRLYVDAEDVEADLEAACLEVVQEDPLGAYAVEFIKYSVSSVVTYCEATSKSRTAVPRSKLTPLSPPRAPLPSAASWRRPWRLLPRSACCASAIFPEIPTTFWI